MQTTLNIDDKLFDEAIKITAIDDKNRVIETALREFIENHRPSKKIKLLDLYGAGGIRDDYDYKNLRCEGDSDVSG